MMGNASFLTGGPPGMPPIRDSIEQLHDTSIIFKDAWLSTPKVMSRAIRASEQAMRHFDHIINEILRARDTQLAAGSYAGSAFETALNSHAGQIFSPATRAQQDAMVAAGPGNGALPTPTVPLSLAKLLNKVKHRHHQSGNFRFQNDRHIFVVNVDNPNKTPDGIVELDVLEFCEACRLVTPYL